MAFLCTALGQGLPFSHQQCQAPGFPSAVSAFIFSDLTGQSPFWPFPAEAAQGGRGHHRDTTIHACSPGLLEDSWGSAAPPGLQGHERNCSVVRAQVVKHLPCSSTQSVTVSPQHFVSCSKKPHCFSTVMWMYSRWKHWKECFDCKLLVCFFFFLSPPSRNMSLLSKKIPPWKEKLES